MNRGRSRLGTWAAFVGFVLAISPASAFAIDDPGRVGFGFLRLGSGPRTESLGELGTTLARGAESFAWNPALLTTVGALDASATGISWFDETKAAHLALARGFGSAGTGALSLHALSVSDFTNVSGQSESGQSDLALSAGWARPVIGRLDAGASARLVRSQVADASASGASFDLGLNYRYVEGWNAAAAVRNFGPAIGYDDAPKDQLPTQFAFGVGGTVRRFRVGSELQWENGRGWDGGIGTEFQFLKRLALRAGTRVAAQTDDAYEPWSAGLGVQITSGLALDYSFRDGVLDPSHRVGLHWTASGPSGTPSASAPRALSPREFYLASLEEALEDAMANFPENVVDSLGVRAKSASAADTLVAEVLGRRLRAKGVESRALKPAPTIPAGLDSAQAAKVAEKIREQTAIEPIPTVVLEYELVTSRYSIDRQGRERFIGPVVIERSSEIEVALRLLKAGEQESLWSSTGKSTRRETVDRKRVPASAGYPQAEVAVEAKKLHPLVEPAIVGGIVTGLVLIFFSNRDVGE